MRIHPTEATSIQTPRLQKAQDFLILDEMSLRQNSQHSQNFPPVSERSTGQLTDNEWMAKNLLIQQQSS
jgi:hypothetical protein